MGYGRWKPERNVFSHSSFYSYFHRSELTEQLEPKHRVGSPNTCIGVAIGSPVNPCVIFLARWVVLEPSRIACIFSVAHTQACTDDAKEHFRKVGDVCLQSVWHRTPMPESVTHFAQRVRILSVMHPINSGSVNVLIFLNNKCICHCKRLHLL